MIKTYIRSGVVEAYVLDQLTDKERLQLEEWLVLHPELRQELLQSELLLLPDIPQLPPPPAAKIVVMDYVRNGRLPAKERKETQTAAIPLTTKSKRHPLGKNFKTVIIILFIFVMIYFILTLVLIWLSYFN